MTYKCPKCNKAFQRQGHLDYHIDNQSCKVVKYFCKYCEKGFTTDTSMYRHMKHTCKTRKDQMDTKKEKENMYEIIQNLQRDMTKLKEDNEKLQKVIKTTKNKEPNVTNNTYNIVTGDINNTVNNISIVAYGKEDMTQIDRDDIIKALKTGFNSTKQLTEVVHFNPKYPRFSNIKRSNYNMKNKIMYHDGSDWVTTSDPHMIDELYNRKRDFIEENIEDYQDGLTKFDITRLNRWLSIDDDDYRITRIKTELRELLFNKKGISERNEKYLENDARDQQILFEENDDIDDIDFDINNELEKIDESIITAQTIDEPCIKKRKKKIAPRNGKHRKNI